MKSTRLLSTAQLLDVKKRFALTCLNIPAAFREIERLAIEAERGAMVVTDHAAIQPSAGGCSAAGSGEIGGLGDASVQEKSPG